MTAARSLALLGATGSIGASTLDVVRANRESLRVFALTAHRDAERLAELCAEFHPRLAAVADAASLPRLRRCLRERKLAVRAAGGAQALVEAAADADCDTVVAGVTGAAGLPAALAAARAGKRLLLANKEALVAGGEFLMRAVRENDAELLPIDSEHNAIFQCLGGLRVGDEVDKIILTASGGPFLRRPLETFGAITPQQACAHPNWRMGRKISVDSATMMNKGLEVIEARWLFDLEAARIEVLIHPQSIVHGLVQLRDGTLSANMAAPDMRVPIAAALAWPRRVASGAAALDLARCGTLAFEEVEGARFPCLALARDALEAGGAAPAVLNAANEEAVRAFLAGDAAFSTIARVNEKTLSALGATAAATLDDVLEAGARARAYAARLVRAGQR